MLAMVRNIKTGTIEHKGGTPFAFVREMRRLVGKKVEIVQTDDPDWFRDVSTRKWHESALWHRSWLKIEKEKRL